MWAHLRIADQPGGSVSYFASAREGKEMRERHTEEHLRAQLLAVRAAGVQKCHLGLGMTQAGDLFSVLVRCGKVSPAQAAFLA